MRTPTAAPASLGEAPQAGLLPIAWYNTVMRFHVNVGNVDGLTRGLGGVCLIVGAALALPGIGFHSPETLALWLALLVGIAALLAAFAGHCSWYAGTFISSAAWILFVLRNVPSPPIQFSASFLGLVVGVYALYTHAVRKCALNYFLKVSQPHHP